MLFGRYEELNFSTLVGGELALVWVYLFIDL